MFCIRTNGEHASATITGPSQRRAACAFIESFSTPPDASEAGNPLLNSARASFEDRATVHAVWFGHKSAMVGTLQNHWIAWGVVAGWLAGWGEDKSLHDPQNWVTPPFSRDTKDHDPQKQGQTKHMALDARSTAREPASLCLYLDL